MKIDEAIEYLNADIRKLEEGKVSIDKLISDKIKEIDKLRKIRNSY